MRLAILLSGRGSNFEAIVRANVAEIVCVISNRPDAPGIVRARELGLVAHVFDHRKYPTREAHEEDVLRAIAEAEPDFIALAGYMRLLSPAFVAAYPHRIFNIHPSLLPAFKGLKAVQQALDAGAAQAGCTTHLVTPDLDGGPILVQAGLKVRPGEGVASLQKRVLALEHLVLPRTVQLFAEGRVAADGAVAPGPSWRTRQDLPLVSGAWYSEAF